MADDSSTKPEPGFKIEVVNESYIVYKSIDIFISAVGFDASPSKISLNTEKMKPNEHHTFIQTYKGEEIPLTCDDLDPNNCNLNISIYAYPKIDICLGVLSVRHDNILEKSPQLILGKPDPEITWAAGYVWTGIKPPDLKITITKKENENKNEIDIIFHEDDLGTYRGMINEMEDIKKELAETKEKLKSKELKIKKLKLELSKIKKKE